MGSYVDDVKVKIAEEYKPPPKINIPMTLKQRMTFNKYIQNNLPNYDFSKEQNILKKVKDWKNNRTINKEQRKLELENLKAKEAEENCNEDDEETVEVNVPTSHASETEVSSVGPSCTSSYYNGILMPTQANNCYSNILQPIPLTVVSNGQNYESNPGVRSPFNISEFEADTSSPFDNVALKSINDVEELAKVWRLEDDTTKTSSVSYSNFHITPNFQNYPSISNNSSSVSCNTNNSFTGINGYFNSCDMNPNRSYTSSYQSSPPTNNYVAAYTNHLVPRETVADSGNVGINANFSGSSTKALSTVKKSNPGHAESVSLNTPRLKDPFNELPLHLQEFSRNISSMGFPLSRVARTCKVLGDDNKKVVDHLLAMSELLDLGFAEEKISEALLQSENDRDKALDKLIS